jgi:hypothetical protein
MHYKYRITLLSVFSKIALPDKDISKFISAFLHFGGRDGGGTKV